MTNLTENHLCFTSFDIGGLGGSSPMHWCLKCLCVKKQMKKESNKCGNLIKCVVSVWCFRWVFLSMWEPSPASPPFLAVCRIRTPYVGVRCSRWIQLGLSYLEFCFDPPRFLVLCGSLASSCVLDSCPSAVVIWCVAIESLHGCLWFWLWSRAAISYCLDSWLWSWGAIKPPVLLT